MIEVDAEHFIVPSLWFDLRFLCFLPLLIANATVCSAIRCYIRKSENIFIHIFTLYFLHYIFYLNAKYKEMVRICLQSVTNLYLVLNPLNKYCITVIFIKQN